ncbi:MAG: KAP family P-loop NTPase fold protein [Terriglobales bacterium]
MKTTNDNEKSLNWLSSDRPIVSRKEDALGRRAFAEALGGAIRGWLGQESLVVALYGAWGYGKSSIKNMVVECLSSDAPKLLVVDFNPWQLANRPTLSEAFFDELGVALGKGDIGSNELRKAVLARYRRWAHRLQGGRDLLKAFRTLLGWTLLILGAATVCTAWIHSRPVTISFGILILMIGVLSIGSRFVDAIIKFLEAGTEVGGKGISEIKKEIANDLTGLRAPILVILDDLDRLTPSELLEVFQLIKANADFPNLIYLVLCERQIVENNICKALNVPGREYLEKIVQVEFDVPVIDTARVHRVLFARLDTLLTSQGAMSRFSEQRWANVFWSGLHAYFATLRDVNRFISTLALQLSSLSLEEVNPIDLIALETIRLYEPQVYKALRSGKEMLTDSGKTHSDPDKAALNSIIDLGSEDRKKSLKELLKHLFPTAQWAFGGPSYASESGEQWYRNLRICSSKMFDRYFRLALSEDEISRGTVQKLLNARGNRTELRSELEALNSRGLLSKALEELGVYQDDVQPEQVEAYVTALFDVGDFLSDEALGIFDVPAPWRLAHLVEKPLERVSNIATRSQIVVNAINHTNGLFMPAEFVVLMNPSAEDPPESAILPEAEREQVKEASLARIQSAAASGTLSKHPKIAILLSLWQSWGKKEDVQEYINQLVQTDEGTLQLLKSLVLRSVSHGLGDYIGTERYYIRRVDVEALTNMDTLGSRVKSIKTTNLTEEDRRAIKAFEKAMERKIAGKPDQDPFAND